MCFGVIACLPCFFACPACVFACLACAHQHVLHVLVGMPCMCYLIYFFVLACVVCLGLFVSLCVPLSLSACLCVLTYLCFIVRLSVCLSVSHSICVIVRLSLCQSFYLCACLFVSICRFSFSSIFMVSICVFHISPVHISFLFTFLPFPHFLRCLVTGSRDAIIKLKNKYAAIGSCLILLIKNIIASRVRAARYIKYTWACYVTLISLSLYLPPSASTWPAWIR